MTKRSRKLGLGLRRTGRCGRAGRGGGAGRRGGDLGEVHGAVLVDQATVAELAAVIELAAAVVTASWPQAPATAGCPPLSNPAAPPARTGSARRPDQHRTDPGSAGPPTAPPAPPLPRPGIALGPPPVLRRGHHQHDIRVPDLPGHPLRPVHPLLRRGQVHPRIDPMRTQENPQIPDPVLMAGIIMGIRDKNPDRPPARTRTITSMHIRHALPTPSPPAQETATPPGSRTGYSLRGRHPQNPGNTSVPPANP